MTTNITGGVHVDPAELHHQLLGTGSGAITFGELHGWPRVDVFFRATAEIDAVIAELVALRNEMEPYPAPLLKSCNDRYTGQGYALHCTLAEGHEGPHAEITGSGMRLGEWTAVITDSERDCDEINPDGYWPCHRGGDHGVHRDSNGSEWRSDLARVSA